MKHKNLCKAMLVLVLAVLVMLTEGPVSAYSETAKGSIEE